MFKAISLVRNFASATGSLDFGEFTIKRVGSRFEEFRSDFSSLDVDPGDWVLEKLYRDLPLGQTGSSPGIIPNDIEDILLLLRLYKVGEISFIRQAIIAPNGRAFQSPQYQAMNELNGHSVPNFEFESHECQSWKVFADRIRESLSWSSDWFALARRSFLWGGAKQFRPKWGDADRILDYAIALESTLVPEDGYTIRRISRRAAALLEPDNPSAAEAAVKFIKKFYDIRSRLVHGSGLGSDNREWLAENWGQVELRVRLVLATAVQKLPPAEQDRRAALARLYDPTDEDRGTFAVEKFREIKSAEVRKAVAAKIAQVAGV
jgi:hypothetical protein